MSELVEMLWKNDRRYYTALGIEKIKCEQCGKLVGGLRQHRKEVHGHFKRRRVYEN